MTACFDEFSETITKKNGCDPRQCFTKNIEKWEEKGLFVKYLPPYSPELNPIEILRRFIKYLWLPFSAYTSFENLVEEVEKILRGVGSEYIS